MSKWTDQKITAEKNGDEKDGRKSRLLKKTLNLRSPKNLFHILLIFHNTYWLLVDVSFGT